MQTAARESSLGERYDVLSSLGSGSAANVFKVRDRRGGALRAAKVLKPENAARPGTLARFEDEFRILRTLHHPHLPEVHDYGWTEDGGRFLIMELVDGEPLDVYVRAHPDDIWVILYQLCEALVFIHSHDLLHQDVKPSNILVKRTSAFGPEMPLVKLIDFGLTYRRDTGAAVELVGTPEYMAPEVIRGEAPFNRAVDYYSLGATLFELVCGKPPFTGTEKEVLRAQLEKEPFIEEEILRWTELYPHVQALLAKDRKLRLEAFENLRRAVVSRLTGGIEELDRAYGLARIDSLPMIGKERVWERLMAWLGEIARDGAGAHTLSLTGETGVGRGFLIDRMLAVCAVRGIRTWRLGSPSDYGWLISETASGATGRFETYGKAWRALESWSSTAPVLLAVHGADELNEEETGFLRFVGTQLELIRSRGVGSIFLVMARDAIAQAESIDLNVSAEDEITVPPSRGNDAIVERFRGELTDSEDAKVLRSALASARGGRFPADVLTRAVLTNKLTFSGWRWVVHGRIADVRIPSKQPAIEFADVPIGGLGWEVLVHVSCHDRPVPLQWLSTLTGAPLQEVKTEVGVLRRRHLAYDSGDELAEAIDVSGRVRGAVRGLLTPEEARTRHENFVRLLHGVAQDGDSTLLATLVSLAHHLNAIGKPRDAAKALVRAIGSARKQSDYSAIERIAEAELERVNILQVGASAWPLQRYYLKQWVESLWARNHYARAYWLLEKILAQKNHAIPRSFLPRYLKGMGDALGPRRALARARRYVHSADTSESSIRMRIEKAFLLHAIGANKESLAELQTVVRYRRRLSKRDLYRAKIYVAMSLLSVGRLGQAANVLKRVKAATWADQCMDEYVLACTVQAQLLMMKDDPHDVLRLCANTVRVARSADLEFRRNVLYRLAASAYHDLGDLKRARVYQEQATRLASAMGMQEFEAMSWARLAEYEASAGYFGNALRYAEKALTVIGEGSSQLNRVQAQILCLRLHAWLKSPRAAAHAKSMRRLVATIENVNEEGRLWLFLGRICADQSNVRGARACYSRASACFCKSGYADNQAILLRSQMNLELANRAPQEAEKILGQVREVRRAVAGQNALMECELASLQFLLLRRNNVQGIRRQTAACDALTGAGVDVSLRLDALALLVRAHARLGDCEAAERSFDRFIELARHVASNIGSDYSAGLADRLELESLGREVGILRRKQRRPDQLRSGLAESPR